MVHVPETAVVSREKDSLISRVAKSEPEVDEDQADLRDEPERRANQQDHRSFRHRGWDSGNEKQI